MATSGPEVSIAITADTKDVTASIAQVTRNVETMGKSIDGSNDIAVRTFKNASASAKEYLTAVGATAAQHEKLAAVTVASTRNMSAFSAITAEATGHVGEHSLGLGRLEYRLAGATGKLLEMNPVMEVAAASLLKFSLGSIETLGILAGIYALTEGYQYLTAAEHEADKENKKLMASVVAWARPATGPEGEHAMGYVALKAERDKAEEHFKVLIALRNKATTADATGAPGGGTASFISKWFDTKAINDASAAIVLLDHQIANVQRKGAETGKLKEVTIHSDEKKDVAEANRLFLAQLHEAERIGNAAERSVMRMLSANDRMRDRIESMHIQGLESRASHEDVTSIPGAMDAMAVIKAKREQERKAIEESGAIASLQFEAQQTADERMFDEIRGLNNRIEAENKRHDETEDKRIKDAAAKEQRAIEVKIRAIQAAETHGIEAMLSGKKDLGQKLLRIALEPIAQTLEGWAAFFTYKAGAEAMAGDWPQAAKDFGAAAIDLTGAAIVRGVGGGGGGSGGGGGGGGGGSGAGMGAQFGTQRGQSDQPLRIEFVMITKDQTGREVARTSQMIQRLNDLNLPVRIGGLG